MAHVHRCCYSDEVLKHALSLRNTSTSRTRRRRKPDVNTLFLAVVLFCVIKQGV